jgi:hypothetical protein
MSKDDYKAAKQSIEGEYKSANTACGLLLKNPKDVCHAEAKGREKVAIAELDAKNQPSRKARYDVRLARANAEYNMARQRCDDQAGNAKDVCVKQAESAQTAAKADAKLKMEIADAKEDAAADKRGGELAVAIEKCDALAGDAKSACVANAKARYGKS